MIKLSIITGTRNRPDAFRRLVDSICAHAAVSWELIVSDASDTPVVATDMPVNVKILPERPRLGCSKGYNRAFAKAKGEFVIWLNDDCEVMPGFDVNAIRFMEAHPEIGLGALYYDEPERRRKMHINELWGLPYANFGIIRQQLGDWVGWFDEDLVMYGNDNSLTFKVLLAGHGVAGISDARVHHHAVQDVQRAENSFSRANGINVLRSKYYSRLAQMQLTHKKTSAVPV